MRLLSCRLLSAASLLLLAAACADQGATAAASSPDSAPLAIDLGGSSRISRIAGFAGEGEGYDTMPATVSVAKATQPAIDHGTMDHGTMDHGTMDHSTMGHGAAAAPQVAQAANVQGTGTLNSIDAAGHKVNLSHNPIPAIGWPAMTMDFAVAPSVDLGALKPGTRVDFMMQRGGDGMYVVNSIAPARGQ